MQNRKKKRHRFIEQSYRLCGRRRGWDGSREQHRKSFLFVELAFNIFIKNLCDSVCQEMSHV